MKFWELPDSYDSWKLDNGETLQKCDCCEMVVDDLYETTNKDFICDNCCDKQDYEKCDRCDRMSPNDEMIDTENSKGHFVCNKCAYNE